MTDWSRYFENELNRLMSTEHGIERAKVKTMQAISIMEFLINQKNIDNEKTNKITAQLKEVLMVIEELENDPWNGECPYNDPTLDINDPYYMKRPFGNTPEELKEKAEHMNNSDTIKGVIAQNYGVPVYKPGEQEAALKSKQNENE